MTYLPVYFSKNNFIYEVGPGLARYKQAVLFYNDTAINQDAPELASSIAGQNCKFNLKQVLSSSSIFPNLTIQDMPENAETIKIVKPIKVRTNEIGSSVYTFSDNLYFLAATIPVLFWEKYGQDYSEKCIGEKFKFLTHAPIKKLTDINCQEWIYFLNNIAENITEFKLNIKIKQGNTLVRNIKEILVADKYDVLAFNVSWKRIQNQYDLANDITSYECFLTAGTGEEIISESRTFYIDHDAPEQKEILYFKNRYGLFESIRFIGHVTEGIDYENLSFETPEAIIDYYSTGQNKILFRTGEMTQGWLKHIAEELLSSQEIYWYKENQYIKLTKSTSSLTYLDPTNFADEAELEFKFANISTNS